jgi:hypothetical protein
MSQKIGVICGLICAICGKSYVLSLNDHPVCGKALGRMQL